jgi:hypothetical protein
MPVSILAIILQIKERKRLQIRLILQVTTMRIVPLFVLFVAFTAFAQQAEPLQFNEKIHDFGMIREDGGPAEFEFTFTNNGALAVTIVSVQASCGCTTPGWSKEPVAPAKSGYIKASYNPKGRPGFFDKTLTVTTNLNGPPVVLHIKGNVLNDEIENDNDRLAHKAGNLSFRARTINFGKIYINKPAVEQELVVLNSGQKAISITDVKAPPYIQVKAPATIGPGERTTVRIAYNAMLKNQYGFVADNIELVTDDESVPLKPFSVYATVEEFFLPVSPEEKGKVAVISLSENSLDFGSIPSGTTIQKTVTVRNSGRKDLTIRFVQPNCSCLAASVASEKIKPGEEQKLTIAWKGEGRKGTQNKAVTIYSTDPVNPVQRISLSGQVN